MLLSEHFWGAAALKSLVFLMRLGSYENAYICSTAKPEKFFMI
jgi:hypothetical protein